MELEEFLTMKLEERFRVTRDDTKVKSDSLYKIQKIIRTFRKFNPLDSLPLRCLDEMCKICGEKEVYCGHLDNGGADYNDNYWHLCLNCLDAKHHEKSTMFGSENANGFKICPFCGYDYLERFGYY